MVVYLQVLHKCLLRFESTRNSGVTDVRHVFNSHQRYVYEREDFQDHSRKTNTIIIGMLCLQ
jgi:hypothetical protein